MPTPTYTLIQEQVLASPASSVTFTSIPQTYKDLVLEFYISSTGASGNSNGITRLNGDTGTNYSETYLYGSGTAALSFRSTGNTGSYNWNYSQGASMVTITLPQYANTSVYKTMLTRSSDSAYHVMAVAALWRSAAAVTSIALTAGSGFGVGSAFRLYGIYG